MRVTSPWVDTGVLLEWAEGWEEEKGWSEVEETTSNWSNGGDDEEGEVESGEVGTRWRVSFLTPKVCRVRRDREESRTRWESVISRVRRRQN